MWVHVVAHNLLGAGLLSRRSANQGRRLANTLSRLAQPFSSQRKAPRPAQTLRVRGNHPSTAFHPNQE